MAPALHPTHPTTDSASQMSPESTHFTMPTTLLQVSITPLAPDVQTNCFNIMTTRHCGT